MHVQSANLSIFAWTRIPTNFNYIISGTCMWQSENERKERSISSIIILSGIVRLSLPLPHCWMMPRGSGISHATPRHGNPPGSQKLVRCSPEVTWHWQTCTYFSRKHVLIIVLSFNSSNNVIGERRGVFRRLETSGGSAQHVLTDRFWYRYTFKVLIYWWHIYLSEKIFTFRIWKPN